VALGLVHRPSVLVFSASFFHGYFPSAANLQTLAKLQELKHDYYHHDYHHNPDDTVSHALTSRFPHIIGCPITP
jgi:hypothetical protein